MFLCFTKLFLGYFPWLHRAVSCAVRLLLLRLHIFSVGLFLMAEDYRVTSAPGVIFDLLSELTEEFFSSLLHLSTSPVPMLGPADAPLAAQGLGQIGDYLIPDDLWSEVPPPNFTDTVDGLDLCGAPQTSVHGSPVTSMVRCLLDHHVVSLLLAHSHLGPNCWPFIIPKSSEKVSIIFHPVDLNSAQ